MMSAHRPRIVTLGETMALVRANQTGSLRHVSDLTLGIGGAESNFAIAAQRLGSEVTWLGRVGDDSFGERVVRSVRGEGVRVLTIVDSEAPTGLMVKESPTATTTAVHYYRRGSAASRMTPADLPDDLFDGADCLHVTGITVLLSDTAQATVFAAIAAARRAGATVSIDINYRSALDDGTGSQVLRDLVDKADIVFGGEDELALVCPGQTDPHAAAREILSRGVTEVVVKEGARGATSLTATDEVSGAGFSVPVVDTVGAGDGFVAGYLHALLTGAPTAERLRQANAVGAFMCTSPGDWEASPTVAEIERFLDDDSDPVRR